MRRARELVAAELTATSPARAALASYLTGQAAAFLAQAPRLRRAEPEAAHRMRVAARRMRSVLGTFSDLLDPDWATSLRDELRWLAGTLAGERDREVVLARLRAALDALGDDTGHAGARSLLERRLSIGLASAHDDALAALGSARYHALADELAVISTDLPLRPAADQSCSTAFPPLIRDAYQRLARGVRVLPMPAPASGAGGAAQPAGASMSGLAVPRARRPEGDRANGKGKRAPRPVPSVAADDERWHRLRVLAKRTRYAAEAVAPVFGPPATAFAERMTEITELIGVHQDASVAADVVWEAAQAPRIAPSTAFTLGVVHAGQRSAVARSREEFAAAWPRLSDRRWRRWLHA